MADIPEDRSSAINDVEVAANAPISEALLNKMAGIENSQVTENWATQTFDSSGTFNVPAGVRFILVQGCGGGGSGAVGVDNTGKGGGGGGAGAAYSVQPLVVTPLAALTVTIGAGGAARTTHQNFKIAAGDGATGATTSIDTLSFVGGLGGVMANITAGGGGTGAGAAGGHGGPTTAAGQQEITTWRGGTILPNTGGPGGNSIKHDGGAGGAGVASGSGAGGGGGGGPFGAGAAGGAAVTGASAGNAGSAASANTGGGGGGGSSYGTSGTGLGGDGGAGGSGKIIVWYQDRGE